MTISIVAIQVAFAGVLLISFTDDIVSSTTTSRPILFGLFLLPVAIGAFQMLRGRFSSIIFVVLVSSCVLTLIMHATISNVLFLTLVSSTVLIFDKVRKWGEGTSLRNLILG